MLFINVINIFKVLAKKYNKNVSFWQYNNFLTYLLSSVIISFAQEKKIISNVYLFCLKRTN